MRLFPVVMVVLVSGCATFHSILPEELPRALASGDDVRITTQDGSEHVLHAPLDAHMITPNMIALGRPGDGFARLRLDELRDVEVDGGVSTWEVAVGAAIAVAAIVGIAYAATDGFSSSVPASSPSCAYFCGVSLFPAE